MTTQNRSSQTLRLMGAAAVAALAGTAYFFRRDLMALAGYQRIHVAPHVKKHLPIAKNLPTIPDFDGNYDMDGVSFDTEGVIIGSGHQPH